jgi:peptide/nickel transport system substrate-binding protein
MIGIVVVVVIIIAVGGYLALTYKPTTTSSGTLGPKNSSQLVDEAIGQTPYDSLDPHYGFFTVDGFFPNVFQGLLANAGNGTGVSTTIVVPALASSYTVKGGSPICTHNVGLCSPTVDNNYSSYNFALRSGIKFSNNDPANAYTAWFSFVRVLYYNAPTTVGISNYAGLTVNTTIDEPCFNGSITAPGCGANIWPDGLANAISSVTGIPNTPTASSQGALTAYLNNMLSNYNPASNATQQKIVSYPNQAYVASSATNFTINLIQPYKLFPLALTAQWADFVDPSYIDSNGGVQNDSAIACAANPHCTAFNANGMPGTGPYMYNCPAQCPSDKSQLELVKNPNYWAASGYTFTNATSGFSSTQLNMVLKPATIPDIVMKFGVLPNTMISDFASNDVQVDAPPYAQLGQAFSSFHANYPSYAFNNIFSNQGYPICDLAFGINTQLGVKAQASPETYTGAGYDPSTGLLVNATAAAASTLVRQAIVHVVNYSAIEQQLFTYNGTSLGELFLPPVPPGLGPLDNPDNIPLYSYNVTLAAMDLNQAGNELGFYTILPTGGMTINGQHYTDLGNNATGALFSSIPLAYLVPLTTELQTELNIMDAGLNQLGLTTANTGETTGVYDSQVASATTTPAIVGVGWCADWADPIYQQFYDMATSVAHQPSWPNNSTLNTLLAEIPFETNSTLQLQQTKQAYQIFTQMATIIQIPNGVDNGFAFMIQPYVHGMLYSFAQFGFLYNTATYS